MLHRGSSVTLSCSVCTLGSLVPELLSSGLCQVMNWTEMELKVGLRTAVSREISLVGSLQPGQQCWLPALRAESSMLHVQPAGQHSLVALSIPMTSAGMLGAVREHPALGPALCTTIGLSWARYIQHTVCMLMSRTLLGCCRSWHDCGWNCR